MSGYMRPAGSPLAQKIALLSADQKSQEAIAGRAYAEEMRRQKLAAVYQKEAAEDANSFSQTNEQLCDKPTRKDCEKTVAYVAKKHRCTAADVFGVSRRRNIVEARHEAMGLIAISHWHWSLVVIGKVFGKRDHTTVLHAVCRYVVATGQTVRGWTPEAANERLLCKQQRKYVRVIPFPRIVVGRKADA